MKLGRIKLRHIFQDEEDYVIIRWFKTTVPTTAQSGYVTGSNLGAQDGTNVTQVVYPAPHSQESLLIEDLDPVEYNVKSYRSVDGVTPDSEIFTLDCDASKDAQYDTTTYTYIVDRGESGTDPDWADPTSDTIELRDERLLDARYTVHERGTGIMIPPGETGAEYTDRSDDGGGFDWTVTDKVFETGGVYHVTVYDRVDVTETEPDSGGDEVNNIYILEDDEDFDRDAMHGKLIYANGSGDLLTLTFPNLLLIADCYFRVGTQGGDQRYLVLQLDAGDTVKHQGQDKNVLYIGKAEGMAIMIRNNVMYIIQDNTNYFRLGQRIWGDKQELNTLFRDGSEYNQADYPRLVEFMDSLPVGQVVAYGTSPGQWDSSVLVTVAYNNYTYYPYKSMFARDDLAGTFRVPDSRGQMIRALKYVDGSADTDRLVANSRPAGRQAQELIIHDHGLPSDGGGALNIPTTTNTPNNDEKRDRSELTVATGGNEQRVDNEGLLPLIVI